MTHVSVEALLINNVSTLVIINVFFNVLSKYAVPLFFFISGFLLTYNYDNNINEVNIIRRIIKLMPLYVLFSLIYIIYNILNGKKYSIYRLCIEILTGSSMYHLWFVPVIIQFYLLFPFLFKFGRARPKTLLIINTLITIGYNVFILLPDYNYAPLKTILYRLFFRYSLYFYVGIYYKIHNNSFIPNFKNIKTQLFSLIVLSSINTLYVINGIIKYGNYYLIPSKYFIFIPLFEPLQYLVTISILFQSIKFIINNSHLNDMIIKISNNTYEIYLIHVLFIEVGITLLNTINITNTKYFFYIILFILTFVLSNIFVQKLKVIFY